MHVVERAAKNMADWHATSLEALGHASHWWPGAWAATGNLPPIYLNAIVFSIEHTAGDQVERLAEFCASSPPTQALLIADGTNQLELSPLGLERSAPKPVFWRMPNQAAQSPPSGDLEILEVTSQEVLAEFETVSIEGFDPGAPRRPRFAQHAPGVLADPRFRLWLGTVEGHAVGAAMAYVGEHVIGIYGVTVIETMRRRGYGAALTWRAVQVDRRLPATLGPSEMGVDMYQRLGFAPAGYFNAWHRPNRV